MRKVIAIGAIAAQVIFVGGWLVLGLLEDHGYQPGRHDISDLGALTAHHATLNAVTLLVSGLLTVAFGVSLRSYFGRASWLVALSLPALDNSTDAFFRLDCRAADAGCDFAAATASWHGKAHIALFAVAAAATAAAPFVLARRMRQAQGWTDLARPTTVFGVLVVVALAAVGAASGTAVQGWAQRGAAVFVCTGLVALAWRVVRLQSPMAATTLVSGA